MVWVPFQINLPLFVGGTVNGLDQPQPLQRGFPCSLRLGVIQNGLDTIMVLFFPEGRIHPRAGMRPVGLLGIHKRFKPGISSSGKAMERKMAVADGSASLFAAGRQLREQAGVRRGSPSGDADRTICKLDIGTPASLALIR